MSTDRERDDLEYAFATMNHRLAGLTAAVDGFAARQQEIHARDYGQDLAQIQKDLAETRDAIRILAKRPAMTLTPDEIGQRIDEVSKALRANDQRVIESARHGLDTVTRSIATIVASAMQARIQRLWIAGAAGAAIVLGFAFGAVIPTKIDRMMPEDWLWPEQSAAAVLDRDEWDAGTRLLQVGDPARWHALVAASRFAAANTDALAACRAQAQAARKGVDCAVRVDG
jgi:hypothetical protein